MSGIAGILYENQASIATEHARSIMNGFQGFPCDDIQVYRRMNIFLGCHAQWITPESIGERNPYYDKTSGVVITSDSIIDNRMELFQSLQVDRALQQTISDTQLILLAYLKWGEETPKYLIGDFAFFLWDERQQKLFGARDFSGSRTLYYVYKDRQFYFSTIIESLLKLPNVKQRLNEEWLAEYLAIAGVVDTVDSSITPFVGIEQVPPSHSITIEKGRKKVKRYSHISSEIKPIHLPTDNDYVEAFQEIYQSAVQARLRTHKKVGSQLSGGLDSGSVVSLAAKHLPEDAGLHTFSYIPPKDFVPFGPKNLVANESSFVHKTVNYIGRLQDHYLDFEGKDSYTQLDEFLEIMEMPYKFFENSFWIKGIFEEAQKRDIGILLNGNRGNLSISWGGVQDYFPLLLKQCRLLKLYKEVEAYSKNIARPRKRVAAMVLRETFPFLNQHRKNYTTGGPPPLINPEFAAKTRIYTKLEEAGMDTSGWFSELNAFEQRRRHFDDLFHWNASNTFMTKLSLKYGLISRDPTNDLRVIRFCLSIPEDQYVQKGMDRALIRRSTEGYLPDEIRLNQQIRGAQGTDWLYRIIPHWKRLLHEAREVSKDSVILSYINYSCLKRGLDKLEKGAISEYAVDPDVRALFRSIIVYRFLKKLKLAG